LSTKTALLRYIIPCSLVDVYRYFGDTSYYKIITWHITSNMNPEYIIYRNSRNKSDVKCTSSAPSVYCVSTSALFVQRSAKNHFGLQLFPHLKYRKGVAGSKACRCWFITVGIKATSNQGGRTLRGGSNRDLLHTLPFLKQP